MKVHILSFRSRILLSLALFAAFVGIMPPIAIADMTPVNVWWPSPGSHVKGVQPFKAQVPGLDVSQYEMFWQVDGGGWNWMDNNYNDYPHKEASVTVEGWNWHGSGPYSVTFIARQNGVVIGEQSTQIYVDSNGSVQVSPAASQPVTANVQLSAPLAAAPLGAAPQTSTKLFVDPNSAAAKALAAGNSLMSTLAAQPTASWFGNWNSNVADDARKLVSAASAQGATAVLVAYNIPQRDCGGFSSGGSNNPDGYRAWIKSLAQGIGSGSAIVILEPDSLAQLSCLSDADKRTRLTLLSDAVTTLKAGGATKVYLDAGHSGWVSVEAMAANLLGAGIAKADGFALNVSNFNTSNDETKYGEQISSKVGGKHFVIDTSRNGKGSNGEWCNPQGRGIGAKPSFSTGNSLVDAYLWLKTPGESDGNCNGGPNAGVWWQEYANQLVQNAQ